MKSLLLLLIALVQGSFGYRVVCVYTNWSQYRPDGGKFWPEDVDASLCTHLIYVYAKLKGNKLEPTEWNDEGSKWSEGMYDRVNNLKQFNPKLKTLLGVGGWNMGSKDFSKLASRRIARKIFAKSSAKFLRNKKFDGLSIDWQHPTKRGGKAQDKINFSLLLQEIRNAFEAESKKSGLPPLLLTTGVSASREIIEDGYEIDNITKYTDFINVMAYDLHGAWDNYTGHPSQLYAREEEFGPSTEINVDAAMQYWMSNVPDRSKLILGVSTYGRTFTLRKARHNDYNVPTTGPGVAGEFTQQPGMLAYYERCSQYPDAKRVWDAPSQVAYWYSGRQWIAGEDIDSVKAKVNWTRTYEIGGMMIWSLDTDDFVDQCISQEYPLLNTIVGDLNDPTFVKPNVSVTRKNIKAVPKTTNIPRDLKKDGLSNTKSKNDIKLQLTTDTSEKNTLDMRSPTTILSTTNIKSTTILPTTKVNTEQPVITVKSDMNKRQSKQELNKQPKNQEQSLRKKKEQQQNKTQQLSKSKPNTVRSSNNKQMKKGGRKRRVRPRLRRKMMFRRRQRNGKRAPGSKRRNGRMMKRKIDKNSTGHIDRTTKGNDTSSTNNVLSKTIVAGEGVDSHVHNRNKVQAKSTSKNKNKNSQQVVVVALGEKTVRMSGDAIRKVKSVQIVTDNKENDIQKAKTTNRVKVVNDTSDLQRQMIITKDMIVTGENGNKKNKTPQKTKSKKGQTSVTIGKTLRIARKKEAQPVLIVRRKTKKIRNTVKTERKKSQQTDKRLNQKSTTTAPAKSFSHSQDKTKILDSLPLKNAHETLSTTTSTVTISNPKHKQRKRKTKKPVNKKMKWRRRKVSKNRRRLKMRRRRKKAPQKSNSR